MNQRSAAPVKTRRNRQGMDAPKMSALALAIGVALGSAAVPRPASAGPEGGQIVAGAGSISQSGGSTVITQGTDRLGIDWQSFNVGQSESVRFDQPSTSAVALNRIFDQNPSQILGALDANGRVYLINPNGMIFGANARINVGALIASSLDISLKDFLAGKNEFNAKDGKAGLVVNRGLIKAATGGSVTLLGGAVANEGMILADMGQVTLGAGAHAALDFDGDGLIYFAIDGQALADAQGDASVANSGTIQANGGQVLLSGRAAQAVVSNVVNNTGVIRAARIENSGGVIQLVGTGGTVASSGVIDASGQGGTGGTVQMLGDRVGLFGNATVN
ncbi:MAG TPA: filamentous hemagglutinin N-terminal domain-containing protein, partial [Gammaproteobacteria bacterium]|nr:filamentous hemagglutinin N-terminal domain-containing protein [Gammaproteobacteria bacterium]